MDDITFADTTSTETLDRGNDRSRWRPAKRSRKNTSTVERIVSVAGGAALGRFAMRRKGFPGAVAGVAAAALLERGITGHCRVYSKMGVNRSKNNGLVKQRGPSAVLDASEAIRLEGSIVVDRPPEELFQYWRRLENLPNVMRHIEEVEVLTPTRSRWRLRAPVGQTVEWEAEIINEIENSLIAWKSTEDASIPNAGSVHFEPRGTGTEIRVLLEYDPNKGSLKGMAAKLFPAEAEKQLREDLESFKEGMESGAGHLYTREVF